MKLAVAIVKFFFFVNAIAAIIGILGGNYLVATANALACALLFLAWRRGLFSLDDGRSNQMTLFFSGPNVTLNDGDPAHWVWWHYTGMGWVPTERPKQHDPASVMPFISAFSVGPSDEAKLRAEGKYCDTIVCEPGLTPANYIPTAAAPLVPSPSKKYTL